MAPIDDLHVATPADHRRWRIPTVLFIAVVVLGSVALAATRGPLFHAETIRVRGIHHLSKADVLRLAGVDGSTNVFTLNAAAAERRVEADPWVADATITRDLPTTLDVEVRERAPVAVTRAGGILRLVAGDGTLLDATSTASAYPPIVEADPDLPDAPQAWIDGAARALAAMPDDLRRQVLQVSILADGDLQVDLRSGAQITYGSADELGAKAEALSALLRWAAAQGTPVRSADLRAPSAPTATFA